VSTRHRLFPALGVSFVWAVAVISCSPDEMGAEKPPPPAGGATTRGNASAGSGNGGATASGGTGGASGAVAGVAGSTADAGTGADVTQDSPDGIRLDVAAPDVGVDPCKTALLCDNFDTYPQGAAPAGPWKVATNPNGTIKIDSTHAFSGSQSVKVSTDNQAAYQRAFFYVENGPVFPAPNNVIYGRMMVWTDQAPMDGVHWTNIQGEGPATALGKNFTALYRYGGMNTQHLMANYETSGGVASDCWNSSNNTTMPTGRWTCMEWRFSGPNNEMSFWLDGQAILHLTVVDMGQGCISHDTMDHWFAPTFRRMNLGFESYQADNAARILWIDDVVLDGQRIGCPTAK